MTLGWLKKKRRTRTREKKNDKGNIVVVKSCLHLSEMVEVFQREVLAKRMTMVVQTVFDDNSIEIDDIWKSRYLVNSKGNWVEIEIEIENPLLKKKEKEEEIREAESTNKEKRV